VPSNNYAWPIKRDLTNVLVSPQDIAVGPTKFTVSGYAKNRFNRDYVIFTTPASNAIISPPRTYGIEATVRF
jgi:iron complex outermembrane recepter protein